MGNILTPDMLNKMAKRPIVFALANPYPEINVQTAKETRNDIIIATGRSDYPNQINNVLAFPYLFKGALQSQSNEINLEMKKAVTTTIAQLAKTSPSHRFGPNYIIPKPHDHRLPIEIPNAVANAAIQTGVGKPNPSINLFK